MSTRPASAYLHHIDQLLAQPIADVQHMEATRFDELAGPLDRSLVLFGAGGLGRKTLAALRAVDIEPLAFADNAKSKHGTNVAGLRVLAPEQAARDFGETALFVVTLYTDSAPGGIEPIVEQLRKLGCRNVIPFAPLFWKYPALLLPEYAYNLPHKVIEAAEAIRQSAALFEDPLSQQEFLGQIQWRLDPTLAPVPPRAEHEIYFPAELFRLGDDEVFVDGGAYNGDTLRSILRHTRCRFGKIFAYEPDVANLRELAALVKSLAPNVAARITVSGKALGSRSERLRFAADGMASSALSPDGSFIVECEPLDALLAGEQLTWLKMDIEGAELNALEGARTIICKDHPILAISVYHRQDHIWRIPLMLHAWSGEYRFYLRRYTPRVLDDLVLYAVPVNRLRQPLAGGAPPHYG